MSHCTLPCSILTIFPRLALFLTAILPGCVTQSGDDYSFSQAEYLHTPREIPMNPPLNGSGATFASEAQKFRSKNNSFSQADLIGLMQRLLAPSSQLLETDQDFLQHIQVPITPNSMAEAVVSVILMHQSMKLTPLVNNNIDETNIDERTVEGEQTTDSISHIYGDSDLTKRKSLESLTKEWGINLPLALSTNPFLTHYTAHALVLKALNQSSNSLAFQVQIKSAINQQAEQWLNIRKQLGPDAFTNFDLENTEPAVATTVEVDAIAPALPYHSANIQDDDSLLIEAQELMNQQSYIEAIALLAQLEEDHMLFETAQEKIQEASNLAVQDLRRRAAKSFQAAIPVTDRQARLSYLTEAKQFLEEAIDKFPGAHQIDTVKQNLHVINKNLNLIKKD